MQRLCIYGLLVLAALIMGDFGWAQEVPLVERVAANEAVTAPTPYLFNTLWFVVGGALVVFMAIGFSLLEAGMVHKSSVAAISLKNLVTFSIACSIFYLVGYSLVYPSDWLVPDLIGNFALAPSGQQSERAGDYSIESDVFFQTVFVATCASIVSGSLAERVKLLPYFVFVLVLAGFIYPVAASWEWGQGWLDERGFADFAGGALIHGVGGAAALAAAIIVGPRTGRFKGSKISRHEPYSLALSTVGIMFLWVGFLGFNGGNQLALSSVQDANVVSKILLNTLLAGAAGTISSVILSSMVYGKPDVPMVLNGTLGGLVILTADPASPVTAFAFAFGLLGGGIVVFLKYLLEVLRIDDVVGAIPVHLGCGMVGVFLVPVTNGDVTLGSQVLGVAAIFIWSFGLSIVLWSLLRGVMSVRVSPDEQAQGLDSHQVRTLV